MPETFTNDLKTEKNKLEQDKPWLRLFAVEAFSHSNLLKYSESLSAAEWTKSNCTMTADYSLGPDEVSMGYTKATFLANGYFYQDYAVVDPENRTFTFSFFAKANPNLPNGPSFSVIVSRGDGSDATTVLGSALTWYPYTDGWLRARLTKTFSSSTSGDNIRVKVLASVAAVAYFWGLMLEESKDLTLYIPTTSTAVTTTYHHLVNYPRFVSFGGFCYTPFPVQVGKIQAATQGATPSTTLSASNASRYLSAYMKTYKGMAGKRVVMTQVNKRHLNGAAGTYIQQTWIVKSGTTDDPYVVLNLGVGGQPPVGVDGPVGNYDRSICPAMPIVNPRVSLGVI